MWLPSLLKGIFYWSMIVSKPSIIVLLFETLSIIIRLVYNLAFLVWENLNRRYGDEHTLCTTPSPSITLKKCMARLTPKWEPSTSVFLQNMQCAVTAIKESRLGSLHKSVMYEIHPSDFLMSCAKVFCSFLNLSQVRMRFVILVQWGRFFSSIFPLPKNNMSSQNYRDSRTLMDWQKSH